MNQRQLAIKEALIDFKVDGEVWAWKYYNGLTIHPETVKKIREGLKKKLLEKLK